MLEKQAAGQLQLREVIGLLTCLFIGFTMRKEVA
jgi:hypothetical protein